MGTWNTKINGNDTFQDIYQNFFDAYNEGQEPADISKQIQDDYAEMFEDSDDRINSLFGLALAQWETKSLDQIIYKQVKEIIESGNDLDVWKRLGASDKTLGQRQAALEKFLIQLASIKEKPKRRVKPKYTFRYNELINITSPDKEMNFTVSEDFTNEVYIHTGSMMSRKQVGSSIIYFTGQGKFISARWVDNDTIEITHDKDINFSIKHSTFFGLGKVIYIAK
jgi:hypothetical protein